MKVLVCLFAVLAVANAGLIASGGLISSGSIISSPAVSVVQSVPAVQTVHVVKQPVIQSISYSSPAQIYQSSHIVHSAPVVSTSYVSSPVISTSYHSSTINHGIRYASNYGISGIKVLNSGFFKH